MVSSRNKEISASQLGVLVLAGLYAFLFCGVDLFHTDDCTYVSSPDGRPDDTCPACMFKAGANCCEPIYADLILPTAIAWVVLFPCHTAAPVKKPACILFLRAPPALAA